MHIKYNENGQGVDMLNVIIIDKNKNSKDFLENFLNKYENTQIKNSFDNLNSIEITKENLDDIDLIIFDIDSNNADESLKLIKKIKDKFKNISFIALSYEINSELVTKTLKEGIRDFLLKPLIPAIFEVRFGNSRGCVPTAIDYIVQTPHQNRPYIHAESPDNCPW